MITHVSEQKGSGHNLMTVEQFIALPVNQRIELIFAQKVQFLDDRGEVVPLADGLDYIAEMAARKKA